MSTLTAVSSQPAVSVEHIGATATQAITAAPTTTAATATARPAAQAFRIHKRRGVPHDNGDLAIAAVSTGHAGRAAQSGRAAVSDNVAQRHGGQEYHQSGKKKHRRRCFRFTPKIAFGSHVATLHKFSDIDARGPTRRESMESRAALFSGIPRPMDALVSVVMLGGRVAGVLSNNTQNRAMDNAAQNLNESNAGARGRLPAAALLGNFRVF
ncbi:hypothetical protein [Achromobacter sp. Root83]|uniref:hypothetical protein n=1 Tax=Achromobacter sp. Root83 TaxID=1736602 RepID=UPI0012E3A371|nr:hypothetical protein [Achromobacter sp. Root83]